MLTAFWLNLPYMSRHSDGLFPEGCKYLVSEKTYTTVCKVDAAQAYEEAYGSCGWKQSPTYDIM